MLQQIGSLDLGAEFLVVGFGEDTARVAHVSHPGTLRWIDGMEFYAIGSGSIHAISTLMLAGHTRRWSREQAVMSVYAAKRAAEHAPGVGNNTDMQIVTRDGIRSAAEKTFEVLEKMFASQNTRDPVKDYTELKESIDATA